MACLEMIMVPILAAERVEEGSEPSLGIRCKHRSVMAGIRSFLCRSLSNARNIG